MPIAQADRVAQDGHHAERASIRLHLEPPLVRVCARAPELARQQVTRRLRHELGVHAAEQLAGPVAARGGGAQSGRRERRPHTCVEGVRWPADHVLQSCALACHGLGLGLRCLRRRSGSGGRGGGGGGLGGLGCALLGGISLACESRQRRDHLARTPLGLLGRISLCRAPLGRAPLLLGRSPLGRTYMRKCPPS